MSLRAPRKGENYELSVDLNSEYKDKRKDAIKRVIASMTVGKGVSACRHVILNTECLMLQT
jgi:AP-1 complex subunit beta-1